jgi:hypothetical protein
VSVPLRRRLPMIHRMRFLRYDVSKDTRPEWCVALMHCTVHDRWNGAYVRRGMRCYSWIWRTCSGPS